MMDDRCEETLELIDEMLETDRYLFGLEFLESVRDQITEKGWCSEAQAEGVENIYESIKK